MKYKRRLVSIFLSLIMAVIYIPIPAFAAQQELPTKFDPIKSGKITAVRQSPEAYNLCWAYSTIAAVEQNIVYQGLDNASVDLSESSLAWFSTTTEKELPEPSERYSNNYIIAPVFAMSRLSGLEYEACEPVYLHTPYLNPVSYSQEGSSEFELEMVEKVIGDTELVKKKIMEYGGAVICYHNDLECFSSDHKNYYQNKSRDIDHSVTVVGWDDDYSKDNFGEIKPDKDGAWLVKSVWGTRNEDGYYWISYCESEIKDFYFYKVRKTISDTVYSHNGGMDRVFVSSKNSVQAANVFTAQSDELLTDISFFVEENEGKGTEYKVRVFKDVKSSSPVDGIECADIEGSVQYDGYYTVKMPSEIKLAKGEKFSVVVSLKSNNGKNYFLAEDSSCKYEKGQTYFYSAEKGWQDCADTIYKNAYINAYTQKDGKPDSAELKKLVEEYDGKRGMQTAIDYCKSVLKKSDAGFAEVNNAVKRINATKNECDEYTVITTAAEWNEFARNVNSGVQYRNKTVVVEADIDFEGVEFIAAGMDEDRCFNGCFQGNGYVFRNISAGDEKDNCIGVFGYIGKYSCVSGLTVSDSRFTAKTAGGIAGICQGGTVTACGFKGEIKAATSGGIVGSLEKGTLSDCWSEVSDISGIIGSSSSDGKFCVLNCFSTAKDVLENVKLADNTDKLCEMLNTNGGINKSNKRFEQSGSTVRYHAIPDNSSSIAQETKAKASVVGITAIVCLAVIICTAGIIVMLMCLKRKKR